MSALMVNPQVGSQLPVESHKEVSLGPLYLFYFITDLPAVANLPMEIFADNTKAFNKSDNKTDQAKLQKMMEWTEKWLLKFNCSKCKSLHVGKHNCKHDYTIGTWDDNIILEKKHSKKKI